MSGARSDVNGERAAASGPARPVIALAWPKADYLAALERAGAEPRVLDPDRDRLPEALDHCDGLLLTGGADVDPAHYGDAHPHPTVAIDPARDEYELALTRAALSLDLPLFAICRGAQLLNVAAGGTLVQDIPSEQPTALTHVVRHAPDAKAHDIVVRPDSCLARLLGDALDADHRMRVNSRHHQAVKDLAPEFLASALAPDGIVEAIEKPAARFCLGVQWHPENFWRTGEFAALFKGLVDAARGRSK